MLEGCTCEGQRSVLDVGECTCEGQRLGVFLNYFPALFFEPESLTEPGAHQLARSNGPRALGPPYL